MLLKTYLLCIRYGLARYKKTHFGNNQLPAKTLQNWVSRKPTLGIFHQQQNLVEPSTIYMEQQQKKTLYSNLKHIKLHTTQFNNK